MSVDGILYEFFEEGPVREYLKIKSTDESDDALLRNVIGPSADKFVKLGLFPFADTFPLEADQHESGVSAAFKKAVGLYKLHNNNLDAAKMWDQLATDELKSLETALKAAHTGRTKMVIASQDYDTEDDILFSQRII